MSLTIHANAVNQAEYNAGTLQEGSGSVFAGSLKPEDKRTQTERQMEQKRGLAQKQAMKLIGEAWKKDTKASENIKNLGQMKEAALSELQEFKAKIKAIEDGKAELQEKYGVASDSQEQKDLELLERYQDVRNGDYSEGFTKEELERLKELQNMPRTEYQERALSLNAGKGIFQVEINKKEQEIISLTGSITQSKLAQLKSQDMIKAEAAAGEILDATDKEIFAELLQQGVDHIDETKEETKEEAEAAQEKREEQQGRIEENRETREEQQAILEGAAEAERNDAEVQVERQTVSQVEAAQKNIQKILEENNLIEEDLKGIKIDFNF